ncbi:MAG: HAMP domain-containing sensor histidine kinase, partial [Planctomycetota bacterium]|nr:HAMP domain-containing sensor histidine kinase [Planctomycetota bacterium]
SPDHENFEREDTRSSFSGNLQVIEEEAYRCKAITEKLLEFSRPGNNKRVQTNLVTLVEDVVQIVSKVSDYRSTPITVVANEEVVASINPQEIRQVVLNLLTNALQSLNEDGSVQIYVTKTTENSTIRVVDNGCGMSPEVKRNLFEPFFTQRRNGGGTGLGLSISRRIVMQHGGSLQANSCGEGTGSTLELSLPNTNQADLKERIETNQQGLENERVTAA